jgi:prophage antirepressor-like protein
MAQQISVYNETKSSSINKVLTYDGDKTIRVVGTNDNPWFCGKDICDILSYSNYKQALKLNVDPENKNDLKSLNSLFDLNLKPTHNEGQMIYMNEEGLYSLIFTCKLPMAKKFKKWVLKDVLPSIRKTGRYDSSRDEKVKSLETKIGELEYKLRSETERLRKTLDFNRATQQVEPTEYVYVMTTEDYQRRNKFKVGGCQTFNLVKSRISQYNSGESVTNKHFLVYLRKTHSYRSVENSIASSLMAFRENKAKELYVIRFDWLANCLDNAIDGGDGHNFYVNENRKQIVHDTINLDPVVCSPIHLEQLKITYIRAGDEPQETQLTTSKLDDDMIATIRNAIESYRSENNVVVRSKFEEYLTHTSPDVRLENKKRDVWKVVQQFGSILNPAWRFKY